MVRIIRETSEYKTLELYVLLGIVRHATRQFCRRFLDWRDDDPGRRQFDQMVQAARSALANYTEGSEREATSMHDVLRLLDVSRASLCELREDYRMWLMDHGRDPWPQGSAAAQEVLGVHVRPMWCVSDEDVEYTRCVMDGRDLFEKWFRAEWWTVDGAGREPQRLEEGTAFARAMLTLIGRMLEMLRGVMDRKADEFLRDGGFRERMTRARVEVRRARHEPTEDEAPICPKCGAPMVLRQGKKGSFWGCSSYPACSCKIWMDDTATNGD